MAHLGSYAAQPPPASVLSGKAPHYYLSSAKPSKYNNSNNNGSSSNNINNSNSNNSYAHTPKAILQNTYRNAKSNGQATAGVVTDGVVSGVGPAEHVLPPATLRIVSSCRNSNGESIVIASEDICEMLPADSTENCDSMPVSGTQAEDCNSSAEHIDSAGTLSNEDSSVARGAKDKTPMCLVNELARYNKVS